MFVKPVINCVGYRGYHVDSKVGKRRLDEDLWPLSRVGENEDERRKEVFIPDKFLDLETLVVSRGTPDCNRLAVSVSQLIRGRLIVY